MIMKNTPFSKKASVILFVALLLTASTFQKVKKSD